MSESFVPSLREYAASFQIDTRRLNPRQLLMHPGPVNRGVELSGEAIDSPQSLIAEQVAAGLVVRMAILYELLAGGERPTPVAEGEGSHADPDRTARREPAPTRSTCAPARTRTWSCAGRPCSTRSPASTRVHDVVIRDGEIAELAAPGEADADGAEVVEAEGLHAFPAFFDPHVHLRTPGHEHKEDVETGTRAAAAGGYCGILAMANTEPPVSTAADITALREQARAGASVPVGFLATVTQRHAGRGADRDGRTARSRRASASPTTACRSSDARVMRRALQYQHLCGGNDRPARGGPASSPATASMHEGPVSAALGIGRHPLGLGVDDDRPRRRPRRLRGAPASTSSTSPPPSRSRSSAPPRPPGCRSAPRPARTTSASPTRRSAASTRTASR